MKSRITRPLAIAATVGAAVLSGVSAAPAQAATTSGYPTALVEFQASARTAPYFTNPTTGQNSYWGYVLHNAPGSTAKQTASVECWYDGDTATGNYTTNRWFKVLVYEDADGFNNARWLFVHASYVYNQPPVRQCNRTATGWW